jgi:NAD(P)-dependent dehydrogenase (short-subunit alcohol dehydrogenase family)
MGVDACASTSGTCRRQRVPVDVRDHDALTQAPEEASARFGRIDALERSPAATTTLTASSQTTPVDVQRELEVLLNDAVAAAQPPARCSTAPAPADEIAPVYWDLHVHRDDAKRVFTR